MKYIPYAAIIKNRLHTETLNCFWIFSKHKLNKLVFIGEMWFADVWVYFCPFRLRNGSFHFAHSCRITPKNTPIHLLQLVLWIIQIIVYRWDEMWLMRCLPCVKGGGPSFAWWRDCFVETSIHFTIPQSLRDSSLYTREPFASVSDRAINNNLNNSQH